ncbi:MAG TPA: hypothetical protein VIM96_08090 [Pseudomonadales bacterium]
MMDPINYFSENPDFLLFLNTTIRQLQKETFMLEAGGFMVWLHTFRGAARLELRGLTRSMWGELSRGMPHVEQAALSHLKLTGNVFSIDDFDRFPQGMTPEPK